MVGWQGRRTFADGVCIRLVAQLTMVEVSSVSVEPAEEERFLGHAHLTANLDTANKNKR